MPSPTLTRRKGAVAMHMTTDASERRIAMRQPDGETITFSAERDETAFTPVTDSLLAPFNEPIIATDGFDTARMTPEKTQAYLERVEQRLALNRQFLHDLPAQI